MPIQTDTFLSKRQIERTPRYHPYYKANTEKQVDIDYESDRSLTESEILDQQNDQGDKYFDNTHEYSDDESDDEKSKHEDSDQTESDIDSDEEKNEQES